MTVRCKFYLTKRWLYEQSRNVTCYSIKPLTPRCVNLSVQENMKESGLREWKIKLLPSAEAVKGEKGEMRERWLKIYKAAPFHGAVSVSAWGPAAKSGTGLNPSRTSAALLISGHTHPSVLSGYSADLPRMIPVHVSARFCKPFLVCFYNGLSAEAPGPSAGTVPLGKGEGAELEPQSFDKLPWDGIGICEYLILPDAAGPHGLVKLSSGGFSVKIPKTEWWRSWAGQKDSRSRRHSLLREEVTIGAAVLHGHSVALATHAVARHHDGAVIVSEGRILHHGHVPQEGVEPFLGLRGGCKRKPASVSVSNTKSAVRRRVLDRCACLAVFLRPLFLRNCTETGRGMEDPILGVGADSLCLRRIDLC